MNIREEKGYTYSPRSGAHPLRQHGYFSVARGGAQRRGGRHPHRNLLRAGPHALAARRRRRTGRRAQLPERRVLAGPCDAGRPGRPARPRLLSNGCPRIISKPIASASAPHRGGRARRGARNISIRPTRRSWSSATARRSSAQAALFGDSEVYDAQGNSDLSDGLQPVQAATCISRERCKSDRLEAVLPSRACE